MYDEKLACFIFDIIKFMRKWIGVLKQSSYKKNTSVL